MSLLASSPVTPKSSSKELDGFIAIFGGIPIFSRKNSSSSAETSGGGIIIIQKFLQASSVAMQMKSVSLSTALPP
ncbi:hypothetical protein [Paraburkholderia youngii]|uniref:hypothetical protein n=1 Tax=Paraburkholderia youngii TaxID=2782701 RepID=UPI003D20B0F0